MFNFLFKQTNTTATTELPLEEQYSQNAIRILITNNENAPKQLKMKNFKAIADIFVRQLKHSGTSAEYIASSFELFHNFLVTNENFSWGYAYCCTQALTPGIPVQDLLMSLYFLVEKNKNRIDTLMEDKRFVFIYLYLLAKTTNPLTRSCTHSMNEKNLSPSLINGEKYLFSSQFETQAFLEHLRADTRFTLPNASVLHQKKKTIWSYFVSATPTGIAVSDQDVNFMARITPPLPALAPLNDTRDINFGGGTTQETVTIATRISLNS